MASEPHSTEGKPLAGRRRLLSLFWPLWSRSTLFALFLLIPGTLYLFHLGYLRERARVLESVRGEFHERLNTLERATSLTSTQLTVLRRRAEDLMGGGAPGDGRASLLEGMTYERSGDFFQLLPGGSSRPSVERGVIFGVGRPREEDGAFMKDLSLAAALLPLLKVSCDTLETVRNCYFFSNSLLSASYPSLDPRMLVEQISTDGTLRGAFDLFYRPHEGRYRNPARRSYWTDVYLDRTGLGLMVTHATPLYDGERFVGIVAVDVTLDYLERFVSSLGGPSGRVLVTSDGGTVLADSAVQAGTFTGGLALLEDRLPPGLREIRQEIIGGEGGAFSRRGDYYIHSRAIESAPWTLVYLMDKGDLSGFLFLNRIALALGSVTLVYLFLLFSFAHRQLAAERSRHQAEKNYRAIFEEAGDAILIIKDGAFVDCNPKALKMFGCSREQIIGETPFHFSPDVQPDGRPSKEKGLEKIDAALTGARQTFEWLQTRHDGTVFDAEVSLNTVELSAGRHLQAIVRDITARKSMERQLRQREETASALLNATMESALLTTPEGKILAANEIAARRLGKEAGELLGLDLKQLLPPDLAQSRRDKGLELIRTGQPVRFEDEREERIYENSLYPVKDAEGRVTAIAVYAREVTEQRKAAEALSESEEKFRSLFQATPTTVILSTLEDGRLIDVNEAFTELTGYRREEVIGKTSLELNLFDDPGDREKMARILREKGEFNDLEYQFRMKDGTFKTGLLSGKVVMLGKVPHLLVANRDLSELMQVGEALRKSEARQALILRSLPIVYYVANLTQTYGGTWVSEQISNLTGFTAEKFTDDPDFWASRLHPEEKQRVLGEFGSFVEGKEGLSLEYRWKGADGRYRWFLDEAVIVRDKDGKAEEIVGMWFDLTARKETEQRLARLAAVIEQADEDVIISDREGTILYVNPAFERVSGYTSEEVLGQNPRLLKSGEQDRAFYRRLWETISGGSVWKGSIVNRKKSGDLFIQDATISPYFDRDGAIIGYASIRRDITDHLRLEEQLVQSQKMEAIGTLAGGIAHDFNNILAAIMGFTELARIDAAGNDKVEESLSQVEHAGGRARDLVRQILAFSRQTKKELVPVQPKTVVKEVLKLLRASLPTTIEIRQNLLSDSFIIADPTQLHQVLMNLSTNAAHAMRGEGGTLSMDMEEVDLGPEFVAGHTGMAPGRHVLLTVGDTGHGMTNETAERIFDPFFTTKPKEEGTGMGLSVVHGIVRECGGAIVVESSPGVGTEFRLFFPVGKGKEVEAGAAPEEGGGGTERILFVDDEAIQGELAEEGLGRFGYRVTAMADPVEALAVFQKDPRAFDLVITDMTMPKMTGDILAKRIMLAREDIPVIICTGFSERIDEGKAKAMGIRALTHKPVVSSKLAQIIRTILDGEDQHG